MTGSNIGVDLIPAVRMFLTLMILTVVRMLKSINEEDEKALQMFMNPNPAPKQILADIIAEKITEKQTEIQTQFSDVES
jgi:hypothetical protein